MSISPTDWPTLPSGDRPPIRKVTHALHIDDVDRFKAALALAKRNGAQSSSDALMAIMDFYLTEHVS